MESVGDGACNNRLMASNFPTSRASLDDSYSQISQSHMHVSGGAYGVGDDRSSSSLESICHSFNRLLKDQYQSCRMNSEKEHCKGDQGSSTTKYSLLWPFLDEWNEYEKYKEEQEYETPLLPPRDCINDDDDRSEENGWSYSPYHALFKSYSIMNESAL